MFVHPGEPVGMNVWATDQLDNRREAIYSLGGPHGADVSIFGNNLFFSALLSDLSYTDI